MRKTTPRPDCSRCAPQLRAESHRIELVKVTYERDCAREAYLKLLGESEVLRADLAKYRAAAEGKPLEVPRQREHLPDDRESVAWDLRIGPRRGGISAVMHVGFFPDGRVGEVFLQLDREHRHLVGGAMADAACTFVSIALQYGAPLEDLVGKLIGAHDDSGGITRWRPDPAVEKFLADPDVPQCKSLRDYVGKKLRARFCARPAGAE